MTIKWHKWQIEALQSYLDFKKRAGKIDFLCASSGGGGKTFFALECARADLADGTINRIIIVTYTAHLIKQWDKAAQKFGLNLIACRKGNSELKRGLPPDAKGYICTYGAMGRMPDLHAAFTGEGRTLVIFDEIHHLGDEDESGQHPWGESAKIAFSAARVRLALSGTPFRSNNQRIPFVLYEPVEGSNATSQVIADYSYSYGKAVADNVCRRVVFHEVDGPIEWRRDDYPGMTFRHSFADNVGPQLIGDRLRFATTAKPGSDNGLLVDILKRAYNRLNDIRKAGHADAGGLMIAASVDEAKELRELFLRLTGTRAIIVHNEEERSVQTIADFRDGIAPWIISVKMITEGVDITRLRVCVYAARVTEDLFFMQVLFRIVRRAREHPYGESYFYYPADRRLMVIAEKIEDEIRALIEQREQQTREGDIEPTRVEREFVDAEAQDYGATIAGEHYSDDDVRVAELIRNRHERFSQDDILDFVRLARDIRKYEDTSPIGEASSETYNEKRERLRGEIQNAVGRLHHRLQKPHNEIHVKLNNLAGIRDTETATLEQLEKKLHIANEMEASYEGNGQQQAAN